MQNAPQASHTQNSMENSGDNHVDPSDDLPPGYVRVRTPRLEPLVTYGLLGIMVAIYAYQTVQNQLNYPENPVLDWGANDFILVIHGEWYRLITAMFLHLDIVHIFSNGVALWVFGRDIERFYGHVRFLIIFLISGLAGSIASFLLTRGGSVGASGAIMGLFGAEVVMLILNRDVLGRETANARLRGLGFYGLFTIGFGLYVNATARGIGIDNWGHIGGVAAGALLAWFIAPRFNVAQAYTREGKPDFYMRDNNPFVTIRWLVPALLTIALVVIFLVGQAMLAK